MIFGTALEIFQNSSKRKRAAANNEDLPYHKSYGSTGETNDTLKSASSRETDLLLHHGEQEAKNMVDSNSIEKTPSEQSTHFNVMILFINF